MSSMFRAALRRAVGAMVKNLESPLALVDIAAVVPTSLRTLNRIFFEELQLTPGRYYQLLRLSRARDMAIETRLSISQIALQTGFSSASSLGRAFANHYNMSLGQVRKRGRLAPGQGKTTSTHTSRWAEADAASLESGSSGAGQNTPEADTSRPASGRT